MSTTKWALDPTHSELGFKIKHLMISNVSGSFKNFQIDVVTTDADFGVAEVKLTADMNSINTNNEQRDQHLRNADFFETEKYPDLKFHSSKIEKLKDGVYLLSGDLTLKGVTRQEKLNLEFNGTTKDPWGNERAGFLVTGKINRNDYGIHFNSVMETGGLMLGEEVKIHAEIELVKEVAAVAA